MDSSQVRAASWLPLLRPAPAAAPDGGASDCDAATYAQVESTFKAAVERTKALPHNEAAARHWRAAAANWTRYGMRCYEQLVRRPGGPQLDADDPGVGGAPASLLRRDNGLSALRQQAQKIDDGGLFMTPDGPIVGRPGIGLDGQADAQPAAPEGLEFVTGGLKWGTGSPYAGGTNVEGPGIAGGTVTFSFMPNGVDMSAESAGAGANVAISSLPTFNACFLTEIRAAFSAWSAVSNIDFVEVVDNGAAFDNAAAIGDIRIGTHTFDGPSAAL